MPYFLQIVDDNGNPDAVEHISDIIADALKAKGVGIFRGENHVINDLRTVIRDLLRAREIVVQPPLLSQVCHDCKRSVPIWHTYQNGHISCTECRSLNVEAGY